MIELLKVNKAYGNHMVLQDVNLFIQEGEIFGIIGKSGAGKSTLLRCINHLETPSAGSILIDQEDIVALKRAELRRTRHKIAMIFQQFNLLNSKTVYENIALPMHIQRIPKADIAQKIGELLQLVELTEKKDTYPLHLSGGQKQRVAIARALTCAPKILLCDEATSSLDPETTASILLLLKKINQLYGITIVLITHEMDVVKQICHRVAFMEQGKIIEITDLAAVFRQKDSIIRRMLYAELSPKLPAWIQSLLTQEPNDQPLLRLLFEGDKATAPCISQISRSLQIDISIMLANLDSTEFGMCGVLIITITAQTHLLQQFIKQCEYFNITAEILGYVTAAE